MISIRTREGRKPNGEIIETGEYDWIVEAVSKNTPGVSNLLDSGLAEGRENVCSHHKKKRNECCCVGDLDLSRFCFFVLLS